MANATKQFRQPYLPAYFPDIRALRHFKEKDYKPTIWPIQPERCEVEWNYTLHNKPLFNRQQAAYYTSKGFLDLNVKGNFGGTEVSRVWIYSIKTAYANIRGKQQSKCLAHGILLLPIAKGQCQ